MIIWSRIKMFDTVQFSCSQENWQFIDKWIKTFFEFLVQFMEFIIGSGMISSGSITIP